MVVSVVDDLVDRHAANPALAALYQGQDLPQLKTQAVTFLSASTGGPCDGPSTGMEPWQAGWRFSPAQLLAVAGDVSEALREQGVGTAEIDEVVHLFCSAGRGQRNAVSP